MKLKYNYVIQELFGQYMAVPVDNAEDQTKLIRLNPTAKVIFEGLMAEQTVGQIAETLAGLCGIQTNEVITDVEYFIKTLAQKDLLVME